MLGPRKFTRSVLTKFLEFGIVLVLKPLLTPVDTERHLHALNSSRLPASDLVSPNVGILPPHLFPFTFILNSEESERVVVRFMVSLEISSVSGS